MKHKNLLKFSQEIVSEGVVLFAQLLDEMLFDYTMDTYKPAAFSPSYMCSEASGILRRVERGEIDRSQMTHILAELRNLLARDLVAKRLIDFDPDFYVRFNEGDTPAQLSTRLGLLQNKLKASTYLQACEHDILCALANPREKKEIRSLARSWVAAKLNFGVHIAFLKEIVAEHFFDETRTLNQLSDIQQFFAACRPEKQKYDIYFGVSSLFRHVSSQCSSFKCRLIGRADVDACIVQAIPGLGVDEEVLCVSDVEAFDYYSARDTAEKRLELISDFFVLFHHQEKLSWRKAAVVMIGSAPKLMRPLSSPLKRTLDFRPPKASRRFGDMMNSLNLRNPKAWSKFLSVVRLHGVAAGAESPEVQLVNLWTALEVISPAGSGSKINGVIDSIIPFLLCSYLDSIFWDLASDIRRWDGPKFRKLINSIDFPPGYRLCHKLASILLCSDNEKKCDELFIIVSGYPLLRFRCFTVQERFKSKSSILKSIERHKERITWQLHRIYRARNLIVHDGSRPYALDSLAENAHSYLDGFINTVVRLAAADGMARDIDECIAYMKERMRRWIYTLKEQGDLIPENVGALVSSGL